MHGVAYWFAASEYSKTQKCTGDFYLFTRWSNITSQIWTSWLLFRNHFILTGIGSTFIHSQVRGGIIIHTKLKAPNTEGFQTQSISLTFLKQQQVHQSERVVVPLRLCQVCASLCQASSHLHQL